MKTLNAALTTALLSLALPLALAAQQPPAGPPVDPVTSTFKQRITASERNVAVAFDSIPADKFGYKPTPAQLTIGYIAQHVTADNYFFCSDFGDMKPTLPTSDTATPDSVRAKWPKDTLVAKLKASFAFCQAALGQLTDAKLAETFPVTANGQTRQVIRAGRVLGHALDLADHYSQLSNYMRLNNILPPTALPRRPQ